MAFGLYNLAISARLNAATTCAARRRDMKRVLLPAMLPIALFVATGCAGANGDTELVLSQDDCDDGEDTVFPGSVEVTADGIDQDCNQHDRCFQDNDSDTYGSGLTADAVGATCADPAHHLAARSGDTDDGDDK